MLEQLIIVAGPSCCGKTHFVKKLRAGDYDELLLEHLLVDPKTWKFADVFFLSKSDVEDLVDSQEPAESRLLVHWTVPHPSMKILLRDIISLWSLDLRHRLDLIAQSRSTISLTLHASEESLNSRIDRREQRVRELRLLGRDSFWKFQRKLRHLKLLRRTYASKSRTDAMYSRWFRLLDKMGVQQQLMVGYDGEPYVQRRSEWELENALTDRQSG